MPLAAVLIVKSLEGMSGVQGGLGEQKRDIVKLREEALLENGTAVEDMTGLKHCQDFWNPSHPRAVNVGYCQVNGLTVKSASHEVDISKLGDVTWR